MVNACSVYRIKSVEKIQSIRKHIDLNDENTIVYVHHNGEIHELHDITRNENQVFGTLVTSDKKELDVYLEAQSRGSVSREFLPKDSKLKQGYVGSLANVTSLMEEVRKVVEHNQKQDTKNQFHCYVDGGQVDDNGHFVFDLEKVNKFELLKKNVNDKKFPWTAVIIILAVLILLPIIVFIITCNCPRVYLNNGSEWVYSNSLLNGALNAKLEKQDFKALKDYFPLKSVFSMELRNEEPEIQHINQLGLNVVLHSPEVKVLSNQFGKFYTIKNEKAPSLAQDVMRADQVQSIALADGVSYPFDAVRAGEHQELYTSFNVDEMKDARLVLRFKNTDWAAKVTSEFKKAMGSKYREWSDENRNKSTEELRTAFDKIGFGLSISAKEGKTWKKLESMPMVGNVTYQELVIPIDKSFLKEGKVEIKLSAGFNLWEIDQMAIDQSEQEPIQITYLKPSDVNSGSKEFVELLSSDDTGYAVLQQGETLKITFDNLPVNELKRRSVFISSKGYYLQIDNPQGSPNWSALMQLNSPFGMSKFSHSLFIDQFEMR